jgi:hypothetical protein
MSDQKTTDPKVIQCPACRRGNGDWAHLCVHCGASLIPKAAEAAPSSNPFPKGTTQHTAWQSGWESGYGDGAGDVMRDLAEEIDRLLKIVKGCPACSESERNSKSQDRPAVSTAKH